MNILKKRGLWHGMAAINAFLLVSLAFGMAAAYKYQGMINAFFNISTSRLVQVEGSGSADTSYYKSDYGELSDANLAKLNAAEELHIQQEEEEGAVLLRNENNALPFKASERNVTLFGHSSAYPLYKPNSGGGDIDTARKLDLKGALEEQGFSINTTLYNAYLAAGNKRDGDSIGSYGVNSYNRDEAQPSFYNDTLKATFTTNTDAAIVVLSRAGGESRDLPLIDQQCGCAQKHNHLVLHDDEKALLEMIQQYHYGKLIVLLNSAYPMELDWLETYHVDAALWIAGPGLVGFRGVVNLLTGKANPSGKLVDTYAANALSSPAITNFGDFTYTNAAQIQAEDKDEISRTSKYVVYAEGIYQGYKYYETRYEDGVLNQGNALSSSGSSFGTSWDYAKEVVYPFGYGQSYTTFSQSLDKISANSDDTFTASVTVKNTGSVAGKCVVELYAQCPYTEEDKTSLIEKSAIQLVAYDKTSLLQPGAEETLKITVEKYFLASYDETNEKGYILDPGTYYFALGADAHAALNAILAAKKEAGIAVGALVDQSGKSVSPDSAALVKSWKLNSKDNKSFRMSRVDSTIRVTNQFEEMDLNHWIPGGVKYLTRQDWEGTYPKQAPVVTATAEMIKKIDGYSYSKPSDAVDVSTYTQGLSSGINFLDMKGVPYDDPLWESFLNQLSYSDLTTITIDQQGIAAVASVNKPSQRNGDGPDGAGQNYKYGRKAVATAYANQIVATATWNKSIMAARGNFIAEDCLYTGTSQLWAPGCDLHRTPFSGRNFEYYSEDPILTYFSAKEETQAMTAKGLNCALKHFAANDQETNRYGVSTFMKEQTFREGPLRGFEGAFVEGGCRGVMSSFNRLGMTYAGASESLMSTVLRKEWGFKGVSITDASGGVSYIHTLESVVAGSDMFCFENGEVRKKELYSALTKNGGDGYLLGKVRELNKHYYYAFVNSNLTNGLSKTTRLEYVQPWWQQTITAIDSSVGALLFISLVFYGLNLTLWRKKADA